MHLMKTKKPIATASGCLIFYKSKKFLLTVSHAILEDGRWGLALKYDLEKKGIKYYCPSFKWLKQGSIKLDQRDFDCSIEDLIEDPRTIDFAYANIPSEIEAVDEYLDFENSTKYSCPKNVIKTDLLEKPHKDIDYSFYGDVRTKVDQDHNRLILNPQMQLGMKYICEYKDDYYRFQLPNIIRDKYDYKGCSGAPILDEEGNLVSLVTNGAETTNILFGIRLDKLRIALDIEVNDFA
jgi:hypothetical protein